jgi:hypothetical protein
LEDAFAYPPGPLAGSGPWLPSPFAAYPSLTVRAAGGGVVGAADDTRSAALALGAAVDLGRPWALSFTLAFAGPGPAPPGESYCYLQLGDEAGAFNAVVVDLNDGSGGADHAQLYITDDLTHFYFQVVPFAFGTRHRVEMTWDGSTHRAYLDGVEVAAGVLRDPATIALKLVSLFIVGDASAARWTIYDFACRFTAA